MKKGYFITGTNTNIGKTFVTCTLVQILKSEGLDVGVMKPIECGCRQSHGVVVPGDSMKLKSASGVEETLEEINPYTFSLPVSPHIAARVQGITIDFERIKTAYEKLRANHDMIFVEGAGGMLTPISEDKSMADLAKFLDLPVIIVAASKLGVLNSALLTVSHAKSIGLEVAGIILNHPSAPHSWDESLAYNREELSTLSGVPFLGELPLLESSTPFVNDFNSAREAKKFLKFRELM